MCLQPSGAEGRLPHKTERGLHLVALKRVRTWMSIVLLTMVMLLARPEEAAAALDYELVPSSGPVGTLVTVERISALCGPIYHVPSNYQIIFNGTIVKSGIAANECSIDDSFLIPAGTSSGIKSVIIDVCSDGCYFQTLTFTVTAATSQSPGGVWLTPTPQNNSTVTLGTSSTIQLKVEARKGSSDISEVRFTAWWPGWKHPTQAGAWFVIPCPAQVAGAEWTCTWDVSDGPGTDTKRGWIPPGELRVSFDVYDTAGRYTLAPNGIRVLTLVRSQVTLKLPFDQSLQATFTGGPHGQADTNSCATGASPNALTKQITRLSGLDFGVSVGTPVLAMAPGTVFYTGRQSGVQKGDTESGAGSKVVYVAHSNGIITGYWHLKTIDIADGSPVDAGTRLGTSGSPGGIAHLHVEFKRGTASDETTILQAPDNLPYPSHGLLIDGYRSWAMLLDGDGRALNYEGTLTRGNNLELAAFTDRCGNNTNWAQTTRWQMTVSATATTANPCTGLPPYNTIVAAGGPVCSTTRAKVTGESYTILPSQMIEITRTIPSSESRAFFQTSWPGSDIVMTLVSPSGRTISRLNNTSDVTHWLYPTYEAYQVTNPEAGQWKVRLFGADVPGSGEPVSFKLSTLPNESTPGSTVDLYPKPLIPRLLPGATTTKSLNAYAPWYLSWGAVFAGSGFMQGTVHVSVMIDGVLSIHYPYTNWYAGGSVGFQDWYYPIGLSPGWHRLTVTVDPANTIPEMNESNNTWESSFFWFAPLSSADINCSGISDALDALFALRLAAGLAVNYPQGCNSDPNKDGYIGLADAIHVRSILAGLTQFPIRAYEGKWYNIDANTNGVTRMEIDFDATDGILGWGRCHPTECVWAEYPGYWVDVDTGGLLNGFIDITWHVINPPTPSRLVVMADGRLEATFPGFTYIFDHIPRTYD